MNNLERTFSISVDVEDFFLRDTEHEYYLGERNGQYWGVPLILDLCDREKVKATFFVDAQHVVNKVSRLLIKELCQEIHRRGHEMAIHTHPPARKNYFVPDRVMGNYGFKYQYRFMKESLDTIEQWIGQRPVSHRAGSYSANANTFLVLNELGVKVDSSVFWGYKDWNIRNYSSIRKHSGNLAPFKINQLVEIPISSYFQLPLCLPNLKINKKTDIVWSTRSEFGRFASTAVANVDIFLHSYSFFDLPTLSPSQYFIDVFLEFIAAAKQKKRKNVLYRNFFQTGLSANNQPVPTLSSPIFGYSPRELYHVFLSKPLTRMANHGNVV